jgi:hypothetical protein
MASGSKDAFERRLKMIVRDTVPHRMSWVAAAAAALAALLILPAWAQPQPADLEPHHASIDSNSVTATPTTGHETGLNSLSHVAELRNVQIGGSDIRIRPQFYSSPILEPSIKSDGNETDKPSVESVSLPIPTTVLTDSPKKSEQAKTTPKRTHSKPNAKADSAIPVGETHSSVKSETLPETTPVTSELEITQVEEVADVEATETTDAALAANSNDIRETVAAPTKPKTRALTRVPATLDSGRMGGLQNIEVHGEVRTRYSRYSRR